MSLVSEMSGRHTERAALAKCHADRQQDNQGNLAPRASLEHDRRHTCSQTEQAFTRREMAKDAHKSFLLQRSACQMVGDHMSQCWQHRKSEKTNRDRHNA